MTRYCQPFWNWVAGQNHKTYLDLISAGSRQAARAALRTLEGEFSSRVHELVDELVSLRVYIEASLDFADEEIEFIRSGDIHQRLNKLQLEIENISQTANRGRVLHEGLQIVIAGKPNAGKSSLMNVLCGRDTSIVTEVPGTTRDIIREMVQIEGIPIHLHDTAGLRDDPGRIEEEGIRRAKDTLSSADVVIWVHDDTMDLTSEQYSNYSHAHLILVRNKIDLTGNDPGVAEENGLVCVSVSIQQNQGLDELRKQIVKHCGAEPMNENEFSARRRHLTALENTLSCLDRCRW